MKRGKIDRRALIAATIAVAAPIGVACAEEAAPLARIPVTEFPTPVAFVIDEGANVMDLAGPWEAFQDASVNGRDAFRLYTVAEKRDMLQATGGLNLTAHHTFADAPAPKVIVMGAQGNNDSAAKQAWIRSAAEHADIVLSICTGAFLLARTGLLDGKAATTHHDFYDAFATRFPRVNLVRGRRWVDNRKFVSAGGLTSGIDAALHIIARYHGPETAAMTARYMEHDSPGWRTGARV